MRTPFRPGRRTPRRSPSRPARRSTRAEPRSSSPNFRQTARRAEPLRRLPHPPGRRPDRPGGQRAPRLLRPVLVQRLHGGHVLRAGPRQLPEPGRDRRCVQRRPRRRPALRLRQRSGAARPQRHRRRPDPRRHRRADAHDAPHDRRPGARPPGRRHVRRPHRGVRGAAPDPLQRRAAAVRRHPGHAVRRLVRRDPHRRGDVGARGSHGLGLQGPLLGRAPRRRPGPDGAIRAAAADLLPLGAAELPRRRVPLHRVRGRRGHPVVRGRRGHPGHRPAGRHGGPRHPLRARRRRPARHRLGARPASLATSRPAVPPGPERRGRSASTSSRCSRSA